MRVIAFVLALACACSEPAPLDLNRATVAELEALPSIGPKKAKSIIAARNARGGRFASFEQILAIDGIGPEAVAVLKQRYVLQ